MKPEPKALQWAIIYTCEVSLCCGTGDGLGEVVSCLPLSLGGGCCVRLLPKTVWACVGRKIPRLLVQALEPPLIQYTMQRASSRCSDLCCVLQPDSQCLKVVPVVVMVNPGSLQESDYTAGLQSYFQVQSSTWLSTSSKRLRIHLRVGWMFWTLCACYSSTVKGGRLFSRLGFLCFPMFQWYDSLLLVIMQLCSLDFFYKQCRT